MLACAASALGQTAGVEALRGGAGFIETKPTSESEDAAIIRLFQGLRVADVSDGMDRAGLPGTGLVDPSILPLWKDIEGFSHRICGIALTARYVPAQIPALPAKLERFCGVGRQLVQRTLLRNMDAAHPARHRGRDRRRGGPGRGHHRIVQHPRLVQGRSRGRGDRRGSEGHGRDIQGKGSSLSSGKEAAAYGRAGTFWSR